MDFNSVSMQGNLEELELIWQSNEESFYKGFIKIVRYGSGVTDSLPITVSGNLLKDVDVTSPVVIKGQLRSKDSIKDDKLKVDLYIYIKEIENIKNSFEFKNLIEIDGYVCKKPNMRTTPSGKQVTDLLIACNYGKDKTAYIPTIAWGKIARNSSKFKIGDYIHIKGRFQSRSYTKTIDEISYEKTAYELSINQIE